MHPHPMNGATSTAAGNLGELCRKQANFGSHALYLDVLTPTDHGSAPQRKHTHLHAPPEQERLSRASSAVRGTATRKAFSMGLVYASTEHQNQQTTFTTWWASGFVDLPFTDTSRCFPARQVVGSPLMVHLTTFSIPFPVARHDSSFRHVHVV